MAGAFQIVDETYPDRSTKVYSNKAMRSTHAFSYYMIPSGTATGVIAAAPGILHSVVFTQSATAGALLGLTDSATVALGIGDNSASAIAVGLEPVAGRTTMLFDVIFNSGLCYRLSAQNCGGAIVTYTVAS